MGSPNFFAELKRRNVYKVAVAYAVTSWLLIQVATQVFPFFDVPNWAVRLVVLLLVLGFPVALVLAWAFELTPEGIKRAEDVTPQDSITRRTGRKLIAMTVVIAVVAASLLVFQLVRGRGEVGFAAVPAPVPEKSIAILPFENLSSDKDNAFFASGIQDEILTALAKISGLKVISRTSTSHYESKPANLPEIAHALGVANILEGSVQRAGERVHINVQLIRAATDEHLWAQSYDRTLADIFSVESEVAQTIADSLRTTLSPEEKARVQAKPTENADAYVLYLRARESQTSASGLLGDYENAARLYTEAIKLDPSFALARARLSASLAFIYEEWQPSAEIRDRARSEAEAALQLQPELGEAHLARALCLYWLDKDYDAALAELKVAGRYLPNNSDVESTAAYINRRRGRWSEGRAGLQRVLARDPQNAQVTEELAFTDAHLRDWPAAIKSNDRAVALAPELPIVLIYRQYIDFWSRGDIEPLRNAVAKLPPGVDPDGVVTLARWDSALVAHDFGAAEQAVNSCALDRVLLFIGPPLPKSYLLGIVALARGQADRARPLLEQARTDMEKEVQAIPDDPFRHAYLGLVDSYLGLNEEAVREGRYAAALRPIEKDATDGPPAASLLALILARTGHADEAIPMIERLLTTPAAVDFYETSITLSDLRTRWQWDPLRNDPRFQKILAAPEPKTIYK